MKSQTHFLWIAALTCMVGVGFVFAQATGEPSADPITTQDCENAWNQSTASSSCTTTVLEAEPNVPSSTVINNCAVKANCASTDGGDHDTFSDYHGGPAGVETLVNCSGTLTPGSC